jgi:hypothetical protein
MIADGLHRERPVLGAEWAHHGVWSQDDRCVEASRDGKRIVRGMQKISPVAPPSWNWTSAVQGRMKTVRFSKVVEHSGAPETHLVLIDPAKDRALQSR